MKIVKTGSKNILQIDHEEWLKLGTKHGWVKTASSLPQKKTIKLGEKTEAIMKAAKVGDRLVLSETPHIIMTNSQCDTGPAGISGMLYQALKANENVVTPRVVLLDTRRASSPFQSVKDRVKESASKILTSSNTIWSIRGQESVTTDALKLIQANSSNFRKNNVWVVIETSG